MLKRKAIRRLSEPRIVPETTKIDTKHCDSSDSEGDISVALTCSHFSLHLFSSGGNDLHEYGLRAYVVAPICWSSQISKSVRTIVVFGVYRFGPPRVSVCVAVTYARCGYLLVRVRTKDTQEVVETQPQTLQKYFFQVCTHTLTTRKQRHLYSNIKIICVTPIFYFCRPKCNCTHSSSCFFTKKNFIFISCCSPRWVHVFWMRAGIYGLHIWVNVGRQWITTCHVWKIFPSVSRLR